MTWLKRNVGPILMALIFVITSVVAVRADLCRQIDTKADRQAVTREMDQLHDDLERIEGKLDALIANLPAKSQK